MSISDFETALVNYYRRAKDLRDAFQKARDIIDTHPRLTPTIIDQTERLAAMAEAISPTTRPRCK